MKSLLRYVFVPRKASSSSVNRSVHRSLELLLHLVLQLGQVRVEKALDQGNERHRQFPRIHFRKTAKLASALKPKEVFKQERRDSCLSSFDRTVEGRLAVVEAAEHALPPEAAKCLDKVGLPAEALGNRVTARLRIRPFDSRDVALAQGTIQCTARDAARHERAAERGESNGGGAGIRTSRPTQGQQLTENDVVSIPSIPSNGRGQVQNRYSDLGR